MAEHVLEGDLGDVVLPVAVRNVLAEGLAEPLRRVKSYNSQLAINAARFMSSPGRQSRSTPPRSTDGTSGGRSRKPEDCLREKNTDFQLK